MLEGTKLDANAFTLFFVQLNKVARRNRERSFNRFETHAKARVSNLLIP
jgi:hypothetical protein